MLTAHNTGRARAGQGPRSVYQAARHYLQISRTRLWTVPIPTATVVRIPCRRHNGAGSSQIITISWAAAKLIQHESYLGNGKMKIITTWHCTEILQGEGCEATPREWLILVGPGEDLIFEVKTARLPTNKPSQPTTRH